MLQGLRSDLLEALSDEGVERIELVVAFSAPFTFWIWLGTTSDAQRDAVTGTRTESVIRRATEARCLDHLYEGFTAESQETVDRDYEGSWFYRLR